MKRRWVWQSLTQDGSQTRKVKARKSLPAGKTGEQGSLPRAERTIERAYVVWKHIKERERERAREYLLRPPFPRQNHGIGAGFRFPPRARRRKLELENCSEPSFPRYVYAYIWKWRHTEPPVRLTQRRRGFVFFCHTASEPLSWWVCFIVVQLLSSGMRY